MGRKSEPWRQRGITLLELVCALVILGALGAIAVPQFADLRSGAHRGSVDGTAGAFTAALRLANLACILRDWAGRDNLPGYAGGDVDFNGSCNPTDTAGNANTIGGNATRCMRVWSAILATAPSITTAASGADYRALAAAQTCTYRYLRDTSTLRSFTYNATNGVIVVTNP